MPHHDMQAPFVVRLSVDHMHHEIAMAIGNYISDLKEDMEEALRVACSPENVKRVLTQAVDRHLHEAIDQEVKRYFHYGPGLRVVKEEVERRLSAEIASMEEIAKDMAEEGE